MARGFYSLPCRCDVQELCAGLEQRYSRLEHTFIAKFLCLASEHTYSRYLSQWPHYGHAKNPSTWQVFRWGIQGCTQQPECETLKSIQALETGKGITFHKEECISAELFVLVPGWLLVPGEGWPWPLWGHISVDWVGVHLEVELMGPCVRRHFWEPDAWKREMSIRFFTTRPLERGEGSSVRFHTHAGHCAYRYAMFHSGLLSTEHTHTHGGCFYSPYHRCSAQDEKVYSCGIRIHLFHMICQHQ